ncbi:hypothetical protein [Luteitalea sp.]|jgi:hypothetical protein|uniref:hypothetical protein n=1 Tax=Luteitalea sp. TaxID=2004800 RepID=UPI0037C778DA
MSDRKYRQHGYQDDDRDRTRQPERDRRPPIEPGAPAATRRLSSEGARNPKLMGYHEVVKCARCGAPVDPAILSRSACAKCGQSLHSCVQCAHFDTSATFECQQKIPARVSPKDAANECTLFGVRASWERETSSTVAPSTTSSAKKAFDDLFNI